MPPEINYDGLFIGIFYASLGLLFLIFLIYFFSKNWCKIFGHSLKNRSKNLLFLECRHCNYHEADKKLARILGNKRLLQKWLDNEITAGEYAEIMRSLYPEWPKNKRL